MEKLVTDVKTDFIQKSVSINMNADKDVLKFIANFLYDDVDSSNKEKRAALFTQHFSNGYCYYFAHILKNAFEGGTVCWTAPYGHIVWRYDGCAYDITGVYRGDSIVFIPETEMAGTIYDFKHIPGKICTTTDKDIADIVEKFEANRSNTDETYEKILNVATYVRNRLEFKYHDENEEMYGCCVEASEKICKMLKKIGIKSKIIEGWCIYDDDSTCTDRCYDEHTWVEAKGFYVDVTASQFNSYMTDDFDDIIVTKSKPSSMVYDEPDFQWLD